MFYMDGTLCYNDIVVKFVQVDSNKYVLNRDNPINDPNKQNNKNIHATFYTPTHIITYPNGSPHDLRDVKEIHYTKSNISFYKDYNDNKCCINIYDNIPNSNKCRIIGQNGQTIIKGSKICFEIYEVSQESNCFVDNKPRLIYVNYQGLYIVSKDENNIEKIINDFLNFSGEVIEVSAIDGKRKISGFDESKEIFIFNCPSDESVSFKIHPTPIMEQVEKITGVKLITPPPSKEAALQLMADIFKVPVELLTIEYNKVRVISPIKKSPCFMWLVSTYNIYYKEEEHILDLCYLDLWQSYYDQLKNFLPDSIELSDMDKAKAFGTIQSQETLTYILPNEEERKKIALQSWPKIEKFNPVLKQIEKISGVKPQTSPPNENSALKRVSELLDIPKDLLIIINEKAYIIYDIYWPSNNYSKELLTKTSNVKIKVEDIYNKWKYFVNQFKIFVPPITCGFLRESVKSILNIWMNHQEYKFDNSEEAKKRRKEIALKPWDN
ncbi:hypothetical protein PIROE2DRAFT_60305 [Piromyces sp. E2]|nr:hypothetical protein PIROE2DRAFT_60305 [Piromyces sp. E2]|eukprot:OUM65017.1 hypothetical protein PIROE2DRAFT_60305 [Piromyces sp. E2]